MTLRTALRPILCTVPLLVLSASCAIAQEARLVNGFESADELPAWEFVAGTPRLVTEGVAQGQRAIEITFDPAGEYYPASMFWNRVIRDWSIYDALVVDVLNPNDFPIEGSVLIADQAWLDKNRSYWNRHNGGTTFAPGKGTWTIPVRGLYRGEAGSRNNDIKTDIDPSSIVRLDLNFGSKGRTGRVIIDNIRFIKVARVEGVAAFDFGPPSQAVMPGWTPVSHETNYTAERGYGWGPQGGAPWDGADRDTTFGPMLTRDFCEASGYNFHVDAPAGTYDVRVIFENCGYWGGEQAMQTRRAVSVDGKEVWSEDRPDGAATPLYRFEDVEPVNVDIWDTYMAPEITKIVTFQADAGAEGLTLRFDSDAPFGCRLSALAITRQGDQAASQWVDGQVAAVEDEFRAKAVCLNAKPTSVLVGDDRSKLGMIAWAAHIEDEVTPWSVPATVPTVDGLRLAADAVRGEYEPLCLVVRPVRDLGTCRVRLDAPAGFPEATLSVVRYNTSRGFGTIAYSIKPHTLRPVDEIALPADIAREFVVTVRTAADTKAGTYDAKLTLLDASGADLLSVPVSVTVHDVVLDRKTTYEMGFFGLEPPDRMLTGDAWSRALDETLTLLAEHGMNGLSGGPSFRLTGWQNGQPQVDFGGCDSFFELCKNHGFEGPINGYGGCRFEGTSDGYQAGDTAKKVAQDSGLDYETALMRAWEVVDAHARAAGWPTIYYAMCDETRVRETAERELEFMKLMANVSARFPRTVRTSGSYSVDFGTRPTDEEDLTTWHQRFFGALDISSLNLHDESVMAEARKLGKEVHIYNQGTSRYSFGLYQWSELEKGVRARWQWHLNVLHGYQFFDLDGREPDTAMICYGRKGIYPTIEFERCREGAEDFYLMQTLANLVAANKQSGAKPAETARAADLLAKLTAGIAIDQRDPPPGYDPYAAKLALIGAIGEVR